MATWQSISKDNLRAAKTLASLRFRSTVSRAYYAAFAAVAAELQRVSHEFPHGWETPRHKDVTRLIEIHGDPAWKLEVKGHMSELYKLRVDADYSSKAGHDLGLAMHSIRLASRVMRLMKVAA